MLTLALNSVAHCLNAGESCMDDGRSYDGSGGLWLGRAHDGQVNATVKLIAQSLTTHLFQLFNGTNDTTMKGDSAEPCRVRGFQNSFNPFANSNG